MLRFFGAESKEANSSSSEFQFMLTCLNMQNIKQISIIFNNALGARACSALGTHAHNFLLKYNQYREQYYNDM